MIYCGLAFDMVGKATASDANILYECQFKSDSLFMTQHSAKGLEKVVEDGPCIWAPAILVGHQDEIPG